MQTLEVAVIEELGRGTSGIVYKVRHTVTGKFYVVKVIDMSKASVKRQSQSLKEVEILKQVSHPHIIKYYNSVVQNSTLYILMEFAQGGDLNKKINRYKASKRNIEEGQIWCWAYEMSLAIKYLHRHKILHRDIKSMNIFLDKDSRVKIGDLGLSKILLDNEISSATVGTPLYLSPEQIRHQPYGFKVDVWGLGCVVYALCALEAPFSGESLMVLGQNIVMKPPKPLPQKYSPRLIGFVNSLLEKNPKNRPGIKEVIEMIPIFTKKLYRKPYEPLEIICIASKSPIRKSCDDISSSESNIPRFSSQIIDKSLKIPLGNTANNDEYGRPITQATKRLLIASSDAVRVCTAYVKHRYIRNEKPKTTINDLFSIV